MGYNISKLDAEMINLRNENERLKSAIRILVKYDADIDRLIDGLAAELEKLKKRPTRKVVKAAYVEAYKQAYSGYVSSENAERAWNRSSAKQALKW